MVRCLEGRDYSVKQAGDPSRHGAANTSVEMRNFETSVATAAVFAAAVFFWWGAADPDTVRSADAFDYAQMGREIGRGHGFSTLQIFPRHVPFLSERNLLDRDPWPNLHRYPMQPVLNAAAQTFVSDTRLASSLVSGLSFALGVALLFWLGVRVAGAVAGVSAASMYAIDPAVYQSAHLGLTEPTASALLIAMACLTLGVREITLARSVALGVTAALAVLTRTQLAFLLPLALAWSAWRTPPGRRTAVIGACLAAFAIVASPWFLRNAALTGSPAFSFSSTRNLVLGTEGAHTDVEMQLHEPVHLTGIMARHGDAVTEKILHENLPMAFSAEFWVRMFRGVPVAVALLAALAFPLAFRTGPCVPRSLPWLMLGVLALNFVSVSLAFHDPRFYLITRPCLYLLAGVAFSEVLRWLAAQMPWPRGAQLMGTAGIFAVLCVAAIQVARGTPFERVAQRPKHTRPILIPEHISPSALIASDISHRIALIEDRRTLRLPDRPHDLFEIDDCYLSIGALVLSDRVLRGRTDRREHFANYSIYRRFVSRPEFTDRFTLAGRLPGGANLYVRSDAAGRPASDCPDPNSDRG